VGGQHASKRSLATADVAHHGWPPKSDRLIAHVAVIAGDVHAADRGSLTGGLSMTDQGCASALASCIRELISSLR
jgi:hypothetical protein